MPRRSQRRHKRANDDDDDGGGGLFDLSALRGATSSLDAVATASDAQWTRLQALLSGLLAVDCDARVQLEPRHMRASWLVVHLTRVDNTQPHARNALATRLNAVLGGVAALCAAAERLRLRERDHLAFWTRVLTSQMMARPFDSGDVAIRWFARHARAREVRLKIQWSGRKLDKKLLEPVRRFLGAEWREFDAIPSGDHTLQVRSMRVALCVANTQLTPRDMELLGDVLTRAETTSGTTPLFQPSLASLEIRDSVLQADALRALASRVFPRARPIDELRLEAIFPSGPLADAGVVVTPEYAAALKSVLVAALDASLSTRSVSLSLAHNTLHVMHLQALFDALRGATRDLVSLSLCHAFGFPRLLLPKLSEGLMKALEAIAFRTSSPEDRTNDTMECELDLSGSYISQREADLFRASLADRVARSAPLVRRALAARRRVTCRVLADMFTEDDDDELHRVGSNVDHRVVSVTATGAFRVRLSTPGAVVEIAASNVVQLAVDGTSLLQSRFQRLFLDAELEGRSAGDDYSMTSVCACANNTLLQALGPRLTFLSMRRCRCGHRNDLFDVLVPCVRLRHLNLEGSSAYAHSDTAWERVFRAFPHLSTLNLNATGVTHWTFERLVNGLLQLPNPSLRRLSLAQTHLRPQNLQQLQLLLDVWPALQLLEVDSIGGAEVMEDYIAGRRDLTRDYHGVRVDSQPLSAPSKRAFLSVVRTVYDGARGVEPSILRNVFEMAETVEMRQILWRGSKQT